MNYISTMNNFAGFYKKIKCSSSHTFPNDFLFRFALLGKPISHGIHLTFKNNPKETI